ncbi:3-hydroxybutyrate dehydrogenase [Simiduia curdlanivorans]|uniref:3-hydroxybutyrate dehydrogenase n=1 Tax=Simiduia curdlanivorans TaxID=1492769 RepID=A0ABV8V6B7_9GAMM|nr:3-hydroxybutyrate dehydrogenase [Simiduia curdlanivorans]MDN3638285.1 3-hydroxybutyrate dehydrogenase [Simiduia curdlanivorans]
MSKKLCASIALVTGAASGIGLGLATHLAQAGCRVYLTDLDGAAASRAAQAIDGDVVARALDVSDAQGIERLAQELGTVDLLINNAGIQHVAALEQFPVQMWQRIIDILLTGPALLTRAFLPAMRAQQFGRIINIGSIHALVASPYKSAYVAAKHGLLGFSKTVALETANTDITINTLCPAYVKTPLVESQISAQAQTHGISEEQVIQTIMLKPMPKQAFIGLEEITAAVDYLASPAARNMTGQTLVLDGGWTAQ